MKSKASIYLFGWSVEGWQATLLLYALWLAPALLVALVIMRLEITCR